MDAQGKVWQADSRAPSRRRHRHRGVGSTDTKSNEITAIPELLDTIDVKGATVSIDAMGCQRDIAAKIVDCGGNYVLALKANHPLLHQENELHWVLDMTFDEDHSRVRTVVRGRPRARSRRPAWLR
jgi:predicted transposase YbfD/YdcC